MRQLENEMKSFRAVELTKRRMKLKGNIRLPDGLWILFVSECSSFGSWVVKLLTNNVGKMLEREMDVTLKQEISENRKEMLNSLQQCDTVFLCWYRKYCSIGQCIHVEELLEEQSQMQCQVCQVLLWRKEYHGVWTAEMASRGQLAERNIIRKIISLLSLTFGTWVTSKQLVLTMKRRIRTEVRIGLGHRFEWMNRMNESAVTSYANGEILENETHLGTSPQKRKRRNRKDQEKRRGIDT